MNNAAYVQWIQEAAIRHSEALGGTPLMAQAEATWVVRSHKIAGCGKRPGWGFGFHGDQIATQEKPCMNPRTGASQVAGSPPFAP